MYIFLGALRSLHLWLCFSTLVLPSLALGQTKAKVAFFVSGLSANDEALVPWLEGAWSEVLESRHQSTEEMLTGLPPDKAQALTAAEAAFLEGKKAFEELNPDLSFRKFSDAIKAYQEALPYMRSIRRLAQAHLYIGVGHLLNGNRTEGEAAFRNALLFVPEITLAGITTENDKLQILKQAQMAVRSLEKQTIEVKANLSSAVLVDGVFQGLTPLSVSLPKGNHLVLVTREGYKPWGSLVDVKGPQTLQASLAPLQGMEALSLAGKAAAAQSGENEALPPSVEALGKLTKAPLLAIVQVKMESKRLWVKAALYDLPNRKQIAAGGAWVDWPGGIDTLRQLFRALLVGSPARLNGWLPGGSVSTPPPPPGGSKPNIGLWVGIGIGAAVLVGGGIALLVLLTQSPCSKGACVEVSIK